MKLWRLTAAAMIGGLLAAPAAAEPLKVEAEGLLSCGPAPGGAPTAFVEYLQSGVVEGDVVQGNSLACGNAYGKAAAEARRQCEPSYRHRAECFNCAVARRETNSRGQEYTYWRCMARWWCTD